VTAVQDTDERQRPGKPSTGRLPRSARRNQLLGAAQEVFVAQGYHAAAMDDIAERAGVATTEAYFAYVAAESGAFRLVFESDLTNESAVRERVEKVTRETATLVSKVIAEDTDLPEEEAMLLAVGVCGLCQITARFWLAQGGSIPSDEAVRLVSSLSWRGLKGFPMHGGDPAAGH